MERPPRMTLGPRSAGGRGAVEGDARMRHDLQDGDALELGHSRPDQLDLHTNT